MKTPMDAIFKRAVTRMLILSVFRQKERYIGEVTIRIAEYSEGVFRLENVYAAIHELLDSGCLEQMRVANDPKEQRRRQYYRITDAGREQLLRMQEKYRKMTQGVASVFESVGNNTD